MAGRMIGSLERILEGSTDDNAIKVASKESREALKKDILEMKQRLTEIEESPPKSHRRRRQRQSQKSAKAEKPANAQK